MEKVIDVLSEKEVELLERDIDLKIKLEAPGTENWWYWMGWMYAIRGTLPLADYLERYLNFNLGYEDGLGELRKDW